MSLREVRQKIKAIDEAIEKRERQLSFLEQSNDIELVIKAPLLKNEIQILINERLKLVERAKAMKKSLEEKLPTLEREYLNAVERERAVLKKLYDICRTFQNQIQQLRETANEVHIKYYIPYRNICDELQITPKSVHLLDVPFLMQISRWIANFIGWYEKVQAK